MLLTSADLEEIARQTYHSSLQANQPLTVEQLAEQFGRSQDWARDRINEATQTQPTTTIEDTPAEEATTHNGHQVPAAELTKPIETTETPLTEVETTTIATTTPDLETVEQPTTPTQTGHRRGAWLVSWTGFVSGTIVSIAANIMHAVVVNNAAPAWISAFWPIALLLAIEVLTRVQWPSGFWYGLARYGGTVIVAAVAAIVSYRHMSGLLTVWGEDTFNARIGPLAVDGLMIVAGVALLAMSKSDNKTGAH